MGKARTQANKCAHTHKDSINGGKTYNGSPKFFQSSFCGRYWRRWNLQRCAAPRHPTLLYKCPVPAEAHATRVTDQKIASAAIPRNVQWYAVTVPILNCLPCRTIAAEVAVLYPCLHGLIDTNRLPPVSSAQSDRTLHSHTAELLREIRFNRGCIAYHGSLCCALHSMQ